MDTQQVLPFGTPEEVREQVLRRCEAFHKDGGFVLTTVHNIQARTPVETCAKPPIPLRYSVRREC